MGRTMREAFGLALADAGDRRPDLVVLDADVSSSTRTDLFRTRHPERFFNSGIAEAHMAAMAAGLAACGCTPVVSTFAFLLATRALDPIRSLIAHDRLDVKLAGGYAGLSDFADGASHQSVADLAVMRAVPNLAVLAPCDEPTLRAAVDAMLAHRGPVYLRLSRNECPPRDPAHPARVEFGRAFTIRPGRDVAVVCTGTMLAPVLAAAARLAARGIEAEVVEAVCLKPFDDRTVADAARRCGCLVTVEEHSILGGLGDAACAAVGAGGRPVPTLKIGLDDAFGESARAYASLLTARGLDEESIAARIGFFYAAVSGRGSS